MVVEQWHFNSFEMKKILNYINGELIAPKAGKYLENIEPATGKVYSFIPDSEADDIELAVAAANAASNDWANLHFEKRAEIIEKIAAGIEARMEEFVIAESLDNGKPQWLARQVDIPRAIHNFRFFATGIQHFNSESHYMEGLGVNYTT